MGSGSSSGATTSNPGCTSSTFACPSAGGQTYPACPYGTSRGEVFPDFTLGEGYWNPATTPTNDLGLTPDQTMALDMLYCSGFTYAFLDVSAVWCPHSNEEAVTFTGWTPNPDGGVGSYQWNAAAQTGWAVKWLPLGGIVFSVLEQGENPQNAATSADLANWVAQYNIDYPMAIDPQENLVSGVGLQAWPANIILDLSTMTVVDAAFGNAPQMLTEFDNLLTGGAPDGG